MKVHFVLGVFRKPGEFLFALCDEINPLDKTTVIFSDVTCEICKRRYLEHEMTLETVSELQDHIFTLRCHLISSQREHDRLVFRLKENIDE